MPVNPKKSSVVSSYLVGIHRQNPTMRSIVSYSLC
jgi:hypothetical protein